MAISSFETKISVLSTYMPVGLGVGGGGSQEMWCFFQGGGKAFFSPRSPKSGPMYFQFSFSGGGWVNLGTLGRSSMYGTELFAISL